MRLDEITRRGFLGGVGAAALGATGHKTASAKGNWKSIGINHQGTLQFIDINSIVKKPNGEIEVWLKYVAQKGHEDALLKSAQTNPEYGWERLPSGEVGGMYPLIFDIKNRTSRVPKPHGDDTPRRIRPDSDMDAIFDIVLKYK